MPKPKQRKQQEVTAIVESFEQMQSAALVTVAKVKVKDERALRSELKNMGASYTVVKKTLLQRALQQLSLATEAIERIDGTLALIVGREDAATHIKALAAFAKGHEAFALVGGFIADHGVTRALSKEEAVSLSQLASREELLARLVGSLASPLSGMAHVLVGNLRGLVQVLTAYQKVKS